MIYAILLSPAWLPLALFNLYALGIQYERGGWCWLLLPVVLIALILDVILAHTFLAVLVQDYPQAGEWTFSKQLTRLAKAGNKLALYLARVLNALAPSGKHIDLSGE